MKIKLLLAVLCFPLMAFGLEVSNLKCEYLENPQGIDVLQPRLSWRMKPEGGNLKPEKGQKQTAYQVIVASSENLLATGKGDLWDSGKVKSNQSVHVVYDGKELSSRTECYWKVRVWPALSGVEGDGRKKSAWSDPANWTMGLLDEDQWKAKWISIKREEQHLNCKNSPMLRKTFKLEKKIRTAQISICGLGYYEMYLNGAKVGDHVLDPTWTSYHKSAHYVTYDISKELKKGGNALGVQLANGVYNQGFWDAWKFHNAPWKAFPQMLLQLDVVYDDGSKESIVSDESWKASTGPITWDMLRMGVMYDARREQPGWATAGFDDSKWTPAIIREGIKGKLSAQMSEPIKVMKTLEAKNITENNGVYTVDFGQNIAGWTRIKAKGEAGTAITLDHGRHSLVKGKPLQTSIYTL
ncbi:hypothetical protein BVX94_01360, partial [bacterium B17]